MADIVGALSKMNDSEIASDAPLTEAVMTKIAANINAIISAAQPIGTVIHSLLTEAEFQAEKGSTTEWILADGRDVTGSAYATLTGQTTVPDMRGRFLRGKNNGQTSALGDADGERSIGAFQGSKIPSHIHTGSFGSLNTFSVGINSGSGLTQFNVLLRNPNILGGPDLGGRIPPLAALAGDTGVNISNAIPSSGTTTLSDETAPKNICVNIFVRIN